MSARDGSSRSQGSERRPASGRGAVALVVAGSIDPAGIPALCQRLEVILRRSDAEVVLCDVAGLDEADAVAIDALARLQLTARRLGRRVRLHDACAELEDLLAFVGLGDVLPCDERSGVEPGRQPEQREQDRRVEEERDARDPPA